MAVEDIARTAGEGRAVDLSPYREESIAAVDASRGMSGNEISSGRSPVTVPGSPFVSRRDALGLRGRATEMALIRLLEAGSALGSAALGVAILGGLAQAVRLNSLAGSPGSPGNRTLGPLVILLALVAGAGCIHAAARARPALIALLLASAFLLVGLASVELVPTLDPSLTLALSFTDPAISVGAVGLAMLAAVAGVSASFADAG